MNFNFQISEGLSKGALKLGLYAPEGFGKSTFCTLAPYALTIDTENGTGRIANCRRVLVNSWDMTLDVVKGVIENPTICKTLVIDTMDKLESYAITHLCAKYEKESIEDWSFGRGYVALAEMFQGLYKLLDKVHDLGIHVILVAHARPRKFELPDQEGAYDRWELKLNKQTAPLLKEWVDALFFGNFKTYIVTTKTNTNKPQGNKRVLYCNHQPTFDAKNRFGLPDEIPFDFASVSALFNGDDVKAEVKAEEVKTPPEEPNADPRAKLMALLETSGVTAGELEKFVTDRGFYTPDIHIEDYTDHFIDSWVIKNWDKICLVIKKTKH